MPPVGGNGEHVAGTEMEEQTTREGGSFGDGAAAKAAALVGLKEHWQWEAIEQEAEQKGSTFTCELKDD